MSDQTITLVIMGVAVVLFVLNRLPVGLVSLGVAMSLWATGVVSVEEAVGGFGAPTVVLIAALFVVAEGLDAAGVTTWAGQVVVQQAGDDRRRLLIFIMLAVALLSALITPNGSTAALTPMVVILAVRMGIVPSKLLMPLAFAASSGALLVLTGSPVSLLISDAMDEAVGKQLGFFEVTLVGLPLLLGTILVTTLIGNSVLPDRQPAALPRDLSKLPSVLASEYLGEEDLLRVSVEPDSPLIGIPANRLIPPEHLSLHLLSVTGNNNLPKYAESIAIGDILLLRGSFKGIESYAETYGVRVIVDSSGKPVTSGLVTKQFGVAEVLVTSRSDYIGEKVFPGQITDSGELVVLATGTDDAYRRESPHTLEAGDSILLYGRWDSLDEHTTDPNVMLVDSPDAIRRQTIPLGQKAKPAIGVLVVMVALLTTGLLPAVMVCLGAAGAMILLNVVTVKQAHRSMDWTTLILVAGMIPLSTAIAETGVAENLAEGMVSLVGESHPRMILIGLFLVTVILGQLISNTATALVLIPIAVSVAVQMDLSPITLLMCVNVAASASLLTPVATPANTMVMGPAGYRFGDYWRLGLPVMVVYFVVGVFLVPLIWPL